MILLDYLLSARDLHSCQLSGHRYEAAAAATLEAFQIWGHRRSENLRLRGAAAGTAGIGRIDPQSSRLDLVEDLAAARAAAATQNPSVLAQNGAASIAAGLCRALSCLGRYEGTSERVAQGEDASVVEIAGAENLRAAIAQRLGARGLSGPSSGFMAAAISAAVLAAVQPARGRARVAGFPGRLWAAGPTFSVLVFSG